MSVSRVPIDSEVRWMTLSADYPAGLEVAWLSAGSTLHSRTGHSPESRMLCLAVYSTKYPIVPPMG